jgi:hypothetical protein
MKVAANDRFKICYREALGGLDFRLSFEYCPVEKPAL